MIILIYFIILFSILLALKKAKIVLFLLFIQIVSLSGGFFIGADFEIDTFFNALNLFITIAILSAVILPWLSLSGIEEIASFNEPKIKKLTYFFIVVSIIPFIVFLAVSVFVMTYVTDINTFKYAEGVSTEFYYSLPINTKILIISNYCYYFGYFLIPLHFYYLSKRKFTLSIVCFIFSLNIILHGLTFFSRSVFIQYILLYVAFLIILYPTLDKLFKRFIKKAVIVVSVLFVSYFIYISNQRFTEDKSYAELIPQKSLVQDPVVYSYFDYLSQWYPNSMYVLSTYNYITFKGETSLQPVLSLLAQYGFSSFDNSNYVKLRMQLWPQHWYMFNGFVAYSIYDYGYILTFLLLIVYGVTIFKNKPKEGKITILNLFILVLLIQIPLVAIFYSAVPEIVIPFLLFVPIFLFMKINWRGKRQLAPRNVS